jgi:hypothetical protein
VQGNKENDMKSSFKLLGIIAMVAMVGMAFIACEEESSGGSIDKDLIATWYNEEACTNVAFTITKDGFAMEGAGAATWAMYKWKTAGGKLIATYQGTTIQEWPYKVEGKKLTLTMVEGSDGVYYKK